MDVGDRDAALAYQRRALLHDPLNSITRQNLGVILAAHGRLDEGLATYRTLEDINPDLDPDAALRRFEEHEEAVRADVPDHRLADGRRLAENYAFRGLHEEAIDALTNTSAALASSAGADWHLWRLRHELENLPFLEPLRADPRWPDLVAATPAGPDPGRRDGSSPIAGSSSPDRARRASAETSGPP
jgi:tetratricopeptide (TPR) repeat protein